jgi:hypothetical protein
MNDFQRTLANAAIVPAGERLRELQNQPKRPSIQPKKCPDETTTHPRWTRTVERPNSHPGTVHFKLSMIAVSVGLSWQLFTRTPPRELLATSSRLLRARRVRTSHAP